MNIKRQNIYSDKSAAAAVVLFFIGMLVFTSSAFAIQSADVKNIDTAILSYLKGSNEDALWLKIFMEEITSLGSTSVIFLVSFIMILYFLLIKRRVAALIIFAASTGGGIINILLKSVFQRERPIAIESFFKVDSLSFPSGHSTMSVAVYLSLAAVLAGIYKGKSIRYYFIFVGVFLTIIIGYSRVYLSVHYPIDVFAGWAVGISWASFCWLAAYYLQQKRVIGQEDE